MKNDIKKISLVAGIILALAFLFNIGLNPVYYAISLVVISLFIILFFLIRINDCDFEVGADYKIATSISAAILIILFIIKADFFNADMLKSELKVVEVEKSSISFENQRLITKAMANKIANKVLGKKLNGVQISSQYEISNTMSSVQVVNGELVWVMPLDFSGFFKWLNQDSIPGYIVVSATDPKASARLVLDRKMIVSNNSYFMDSIKRIAYFKSGLKECSTHLEINDEGKPYFISLIKTPESHYAGYKVEEVIITDSESGISELMTTKTAAIKYPWIDRLAVLCSKLTKNRAQNIGLRTDNHSII